MNVKDLTLDEKLTLLCGKDNWSTETCGGKVAEIRVSDGPHGLRFVTSVESGREITADATAMPSLSVIANGWNKRSAYEQGGVIADDCADNGVDVLLAPGVNIKKTPLCGRNFEYFSEDPYLAGTLAAEYINGVQSRGVGACLKHFCANNVESDRLWQSSEVDERTLNEIYLKPFEIALKAKPWTVMCSYNPINGVYASENRKMLVDVLRKRLGFDGLVMSDWWAVHNGYKAVRAGCNLRMPHDENNFTVLKDAYEKGYITDEQINEGVSRVLALAEKVNSTEKHARTDKEQRHIDAVKIAEEGIVLLKNGDGILPVVGKKIAVSGAFSITPVIGGGGSSTVNTAYKIPTLAQAIEDITGERVESSTGVFENSFATAKLAYSQAYNADVCVVVVGDGMQKISEGYDRNTIKLSPEQENYIIELSKYNKNLVVVIESGSAVDVSVFETYAKAIIFAGYAGEGVNEALAAIITGKVCPSGKLAETFTYTLEDTYMGNYMGDGLTVDYGDGVFVGYRYYDRYEIPVRYPFGFGLSYAEFEYSDLKIEKTGDTDYTLSYTIKNVSKFDGKEISQVYVRDVIAMVTRPVKELKGYSKDLIKAGEEKRVSVKLDFSSFAYYSVAMDKWFVENGDFEILIGSSSSDIKLVGIIKIDLPDDGQPSQI